MRRGEAGRASRGRRGFMPAVERFEGRQLLAAGVSSLAGFVYCDVNNDGVKESGEAPVVGATLVLGGTQSGGQVVAFTTTTSSTGAYQFSNLVPGTYSLTETPPAGSAYLGGKVTQGTPGTGSTGARVISGIVLAAGVTGQNNDFAEHLPTPVVKSDLMLVTARGPSQIIVTFDRAIDPTDATTLSNYSLSVAVKTRKGVVYQPVSITHATLDASHQTVYLTVARRLNVFGTNVLTVHGYLNPCTFATDFKGNVGVIPPGLGAVLTPPKTR
jgi:SdrD B-like domain